MKYPSTTTYPSTTDYPEQGDTDKRVIVDTKKHPAVPGTHTGFDGKKE